MTERPTDHEPIPPGLCTRCGRQSATRVRAVTGWLTCPACADELAWMEQASEEGQDDPDQYDRRHGL